jgi:Peptidase C13 family
MKVKTLLIALLLTAACTSEARAPDPPQAAAIRAVPAERWRAVLIAGDNNSPAFDNGVEALRDKLVQRGVRDIRILTSDPGANPSVPVATATNVSSALRTAGGEACLAFITSHGDKNGVALRVPKGYIGPGVLGTAIDAGCGQRPTVVIVSACHSGIFLTNAMRQPNRVVLTAASADRVSFGCGAGDKYTYYDQCLLEQFDRAVTWRQLAQATRACVEDLEQSMGVSPPSQPQVFVGAAVNDLRIPGR